MRDHTSRSRRLQERTPIHLKRVFGSAEQGRRREPTGLQAMITAVQILEVTAVKSLVMAGYATASPSYEGLRDPEHGESMFMITRSLRGYCLSVRGGKQKWIKNTTRRFVGCVSLALLS